MKRITFIRNITAAALALTLSGCGKSDAQKAGEPPVLRIGFFPNITHAQALVAYHETQTKGAEGVFGFDGGGAAMGNYQHTFSVNLLLFLSGQFGIMATVSKLSPHH